MRYFLLPISLGLLFVASLNIYVDPSNRWGRSDFSFSNNWALDESWVGPIRIEERRLRTKQIPLLEKTDVLGVGSSRIMNVETEMLAKDMSFYNASVSGASVWDYVAQWQQFKDSNNIPKKMIIYVDTWVFNKNTWHKYRWTPNFKQVFNFLVDQPHNLKDTSLILKASIDWLTGLFGEVTDLFSPGVLKVSLQQLKIVFKGESQRTNYITKIADRPALYPSWRSDGSKLYPKSDLVPKSLEEINAIGKNIAVGGMYVYMMNWETDNAAIDLMKLLMADAKKHGTEVLLVQPPFQHEAYNIVLRRVEYSEIIKEFDSAISKITENVSNVTYCDVFDPGKPQCEPTEFMDSAHTHSSCAKKIVDYCVTKWLESGVQ